MFRQGGPVKNVNTVDKSFIASRNGWTILGKRITCGMRRGWFFVEPDSRGPGGKTSSTSPCTDE